jgi:hypothetical protein
VESLLRETRNLSTRSIVEKLESLGVNVRGDGVDGKIMRTSVILNRAHDKFKSDRSLGWSLKKPKPHFKNSEGAGIDVR